MMQFLILTLAVILGVQCESEYFDFDNIEDITHAIASLPLRDINRVLICLNGDARKQTIPHKFTIFRVFSNIDIKYLDIRDCPSEIEADKHGQRSILAVIAPKPESLTLSDSEVPIYFYEAPYFLEELEAYSNAFPALYDWRPLKHAFTHFFEQQDWIRIAIVSDYSPYSAAFEEELVGHLNEKQLVYNVQRCVEDRDRCDFTEPMKFIKYNDAFIVVANVDAKNAQALVSYAVKHGVTNRYGFVWLARDWPFGDIPKPTYDFGPIVSLTLAPLLKETVSSQFNEILDGPHIASILQGLSLVEDAVKSITNRERIDYFYRDIANQMNMTISNTHNTQAFIRRMSLENYDTTVISVVANSNSITSYRPVHEYGPKVSDVKQCSMMRSNVFTDPCNDYWISWIVIVVLLFILLFLLIIYVYIRFFPYFVRVSYKRQRN